MKDWLIVGLCGVNEVFVQLSGCWVCWPAPGRLTICAGPSTAVPLTAGDSSLLLLTLQRSALLNLESRSWSSSWGTLQGAAICFGCTWKPVDQKNVFISEGSVDLGQSGSSTTRITSKFWLWKKVQKTCQVCHKHIGQLSVSLLCHRKRKEIAVDHKLIPEHLYNCVIVGHDWCGFWLLIRQPICAWVSPWYLSHTQRFMIRTMTNDAPSDAAAVAASSFHLKNYWIQAELKTKGGSRWRGTGSHCSCPWMKKNSAFTRGWQEQIGTISIPLSIIVCLWA